MGGQALKFKIEDLTLPTGRQGFNIWLVCDFFENKILPVNDLRNNDLITIAH
jgi:hypothetical protein